MSKGQKKKVTVKVMPGEAVFVASVDILQHIAETYIHISKEAQTQEDADSWLSVAYQIDEWISKTYYSGEEDYEEEW